MLAACLTCTRFEPNLEWAVWHVVLFVECPEARKDVFTVPRKDRSVFHAIQANCASIASVSKYQERC